MTLTHVVRILHITMSLPICPKRKYQMTYMSYTLELYPITMSSKPKLPEESSAQVCRCHMPRDTAGALEYPCTRDVTNEKLICRMCTTFWNISGILC